MPDRRGIDGPADIRLAFGPIYVGIGGTIDDQLGFHVGQVPADGPAVGQVERVDVDGHRVCAQHVGEFAAQLAGRAGDKDPFHAFTAFLATVTEKKSGVRS